MEKSYQDKFALNQSAIKDWREMSPKQWYEKHILKTSPRRTSAALEFGNLLDTLCFSPKQFDKRFVKSDVEVPSDKVALICKTVLNEINATNQRIDEMDDNCAEIIQGSARKPPKKPISLDDPINEDLVKRVCLDNDHYKNNPTQAYNDVIKKGLTYFNFIKEIGNRLVVTEEDLGRAETLKEILLNDPVSRGFFIPKKGCEVIFQKQIFTDFEITGIEGMEFFPMKGILDIIHINDKRKEIREVDLKFTEDAFGFIDAARRFDYATQHSVYDFLIREWIKTYNKGIYKDYTVMPPLNVVIDDTDRIPYIYTYKPVDLVIKRTGLEGTRFKGWEETVYEIVYHLQHNDWMRPVEHLKHGFITFDFYNRK